jgi:hypothetical protein
MNAFKDDRNARTYRVTGINLRSKPSGESDRLMTILTKEAGLIRVIAPSARKQKSSLSGRSSLFVVNDLLIARGKSMDKITQADSLESFPRRPIFSRTRPSAGPERSIPRGVVLSIDGTFTSVARGRTGDDFTEIDPWGVSAFGDRRGRTADVSLLSEW